MSINLRKDKEPLKPLPERILAFLSAHVDEGYSFFEIIAAVEGYDDVLASYSVLLVEKAAYDRSATHDKYREAIEALLAEGRIARVEQEETTYYYLARSATREERT